MSFFKKNNAKTTFLSSIICAVALLNLITLVFPVAVGEFSTLSGVESFYANGFTFAFGRVPVFVDRSANWMKLFALIQFTASIIIIVLLLCYVLIRRSFDLKSLSIAVFSVSGVTGLGYLIVGLVAYLPASEIELDNYSSLTAVFVPMILLVVLISTYFLVKTQMPDGYSFKKKKKNKRS